MIKLSLTYRDGVSESQFNQVINIELNQIIEVWMCSNCSLVFPWNLFSFWSQNSIIFSRPAISWKKIGVQSSLSLLHKKTTTQDFSRPTHRIMCLLVCNFSYLALLLVEYNLIDWFYRNFLEIFCMPGTVIDNAICHPKTNDFYMCAHAGPIVSL